MTASRLTPLQVRVLELLADAEPRWTLSGGGALVGFHLHHRVTRDLDLFWQGRDELGASRAWVVRTLEASGLGVEPLQTSPLFVRLRVQGDDESVVLDLIADPIMPIDAPEEVALGDTFIRVDTVHEILVNKLGALLGRSELRDLVDLRELLVRGGDLERALRDVPQKDAGFSVPTLAWVLRTLPLEAMARAHDLDDEQRDALDTFRLELVDRLVGMSKPDR